MANMTAAEQSLSISVRGVCTLAGAMLASIGFGVWRVSPVFLALYRDLGMSLGWRQQWLQFLGSPLTLGLFCALGAGIIIAAWKMRLDKVGWLALVSVVLTWVGVTGAVCFFLLLLGLPATSGVEG